MRIVTNSGPPRFAPLSGSKGVPAPLERLRNWMTGLPESGHARPRVMNDPIARDATWERCSEALPLVREPCTSRPGRGSWGVERGPSGVSTGPRRGPARRGVVAGPEWDPEPQPFIQGSPGSGWGREPEHLCREERVERSDCSHQFSESHRWNLERELLRGLRDPFDGSPEEYAAWKRRIQRELDGLRCSPAKELEILISNTKGRPRKMLKRLCNVEARPQLALQRAWSSLLFRFGHQELVKEALERKIADVKPIKSQNHLPAMEDLVDLCREILAGRSTYPELTCFDEPSRMEAVWSKMPAEFIDQWINRVGELQDYWELQGGPYRRPDFGTLV